MTEVEKLKMLTGKVTRACSPFLIADSTEYVLGYTNRTELPPALNKTVRDLAVIAYNRMGTEGETGRSEGRGELQF